MEESQQIKTLFSFLQGFIYLTVIVDICLFVLVPYPIFPAMVQDLALRVGMLPVYENVVYSKLFTFFIVLVVSIGTKAKKDLNIHPFRSIGLPLLFGFTIFFSGYFFSNYRSDITILSYNEQAAFDLFDLLYIVSAFVGSILIHVALDNVSKIIKSNLMKDRFNIENESFDQNKKLEQSEYSVNIPIQFYYNRRIHHGWMNIVNVFRAILLIGTPGSGKTFSVIQPYIKQLMSKGFSSFVYDFKYPDLSRLTYYHYLLNKKNGKLKNHSFHAINLNDVEYSRRINPLSPEYVKSLADATETADALLQALRKVDSSTGTDQFFTQSAVNMLSCVIYFLSRYEDGKYSTFPHVLSFLNRTYDEIFKVLYQEPELESLLSPFKSAHEKKAYDQLEGQLGTLKINISRLATKETFWVFSGNDFNLKISDPQDPSVLVIANDIDTQEINSACYSLVLNRLTKLVNKKGGLPVFIAIDEVPTLYLHKIENLIATARSNKVAVLVGLQELPQFRQQYGKQTADSIASVIANIIAGQVRNKETLDWLEKLFGRIRQLKQGMNIDRNRTSVSLNEQLDYLIPASKIASLTSGQLVAQIAQEATAFNGQHVKSTYNCKVNLDTSQIEKEEKCYVDLPKFYKFDSEIEKAKVLRDNMIKINQDVQLIIQNHQVLA